MLYLRRREGDNVLEEKVYIDRKKVVSRNNPSQDGVDRYSVFSVGNGNFAFTADVTGLQTLYQEYDEWKMPLCTMSTWGWHRTPINDRGEYYSDKDLRYTEYLYNNRKVTYPVKKQPGNEAVYEWLRKNPHKMDLFRLSFKWEGREISQDEISDVHQILHLYEGILESSFKINGVSCKVTTVCHQNEDALGIKVVSDALLNGQLQVSIAFAYPSESMSGADWESEQSHTSVLHREEDKRYCIARRMDETEYYVDVNVNEKCNVTSAKEHCFDYTFDSSEVEMVVLAASNMKNIKKILYRDVINSSRTNFTDFWEKGGIVDFRGSTDQRAFELERRIILSQYLLKIQCTGDIPPQETGLTCNSWYGKQHLEMYFWHCAYLPLWNHTELMEKSFDWYVKILDVAKQNAKRNGYKGARWPKMVGYDGVDSPSKIAPLLIWQQPHLICMLDFACENQENKELLQKYWILVRESAVFMADFVVLNEETGRYDLVAPIIPAQERFDAATVKNPTYETAYWRYGLETAAKFAKQLGYNEEAQEWMAVSEKMAQLPVGDGMYLSCENCKDNFTQKNIDHPSMLAAYGVLTDKTVDRDIMKKTLQTVVEKWEFPTLWGWDFAVMAMTAVRLGEPDLAMDLLLKNTMKNIYVNSGHNYQKTRGDLPLYLPGNGSLMLAVAMMIAGFEGQTHKMPGIPKIGWKVNYEGIHPIPF